MSVLLSCLLSSACSGDDDSGNGAAAGAGASAGQSGVSGVSGAGGPGAGSSAGGNGTGGGLSSLAVDPVTGTEPVDTSFGAGLRGCRADFQCETMPCDRCQLLWKCVTPGGMPPSACGTACCGNPAMCQPPPSNGPPGPPCVDDTPCVRPEAAHCVDGECVQCRDSADCRDPWKPVCSEGTCLQCVADTDCTRDPTLALCLGGECRQCTQDAQCPSDKPHCVGNLCKPCLTTDDCAQGTCVANQCQPECASDAECLGPGKPLHCSASLRCEEIACTTDAQCPAEFVCAERGVCTLAACKHDVECPKGAPYCVQQVCFPTLGTCHPLMSP